MALVVLSLATVPGARAAVLAGPLTNAANAHTYYLLSTNTWTASEAEARELGGHLVTINDPAENQWVLNTFFPWTGDAGLWIGLNDAANEGQFVWASGEPVLFTYWYPGEPNNLGGEDYAAIRRPFESPPTGSWNDTSGLVHPTAPMFGVVELPPDPTPLPAAATLPADQFMPGSARLNGLATASGSPTLAWFEWGTSLAYGNATPPQSVGSGNNVVGFSNVIVGLLSGTEYHFRALASNAFGAVYGADQTFNLPPATNTWTGADPSGYWSAPANWSPAGVPVNGNDLVFPGGLPPGDMVSTNDLTGSNFRSIRFGGASRHTIRGNPMTLTNRANVIINNGTNVIACDLTFSGTPSTPTSQFPSIRGSASSFGRTTELTVIGNVGGGSLYVLVEQLVIRGQFTGGSLRLFSANLALYGDNPNPVSLDTQVSTIFVQGSQPNLNIRFLFEMESASASHLSGDGVIGDATEGYGNITLNSTLSAKSVILNNWLNIHLHGTNVGEYGRLVASGDVELSYGSLLPSADFSPQAGQVFTILEKTSPGPITRRFFGGPSEFLGPEGTITFLNGMPFRISYVGGDGNDVTLTVEGPVNDPPTVSIISPTNSAIVAAPFGGTIQANAVDSDGTVVRVDFFSDAALVGSVNSAPFNLAVTNIAAGTRALHAVATDDRGATHRSATVTVTVVTPVPILLGAVQQSFGTPFVFSYSADVGLRYAVERSATLSNWTTIRTDTANVNPMTFTDTDATDRMNFYRVRRLPNP